MQQSAAVAVAAEGPSNTTAGLAGCLVGRAVCTTNAHLQGQCGPMRMLNGWAGVGNICDTGGPPNKNPTECVVVSPIISMLMPELQLYFCVNRPTIGYFELNFASQSDRASNSIAPKPVRSSLQSATLVLMSAKARATSRPANG